ncbi:Regulator of chromosome condensation (RCC1) family with FYVE zinc finger domain [Quillaja saponaria]|uniref:Regulator of chromosome condensation (RCC1) family with FYVE zinc finger domain n=1 Tax=Quillaja saponaria TaxID=32244 RepID=A0AAD7KR91_QUISA|nr:Regulator of chromosome condensation (RCC1) family with FYVE zinc finger domain [Quillaja saponaria]
MADPQRSGLGEMDTEQAITALKKGAYLLKYRRRGKPKFCPFHLSNDESLLIWYSGKEEKQLKLSQVTKIIPGQRTAIFQRYPRPEKEYQSFSLICSDRSLDLICKDKDEAEVWFVGLKALVARSNFHKWRNDSRSNIIYSDTPNSRTRRNSPSITPFDPGDTEGVPFENISPNRLGKAFCDIISYTAAGKSFSQTESIETSPLSSGSVDNSNNRSSAAETFRVSLSSAVSSSSQGSSREDFDALGDVYIWGEGIGDGILGGGLHKVGSSSSSTINALVPKALESTVVLDIHNIACGYRHAVLVTKQGEIFSWGEESGGRLGHGVEADVPQPKLIDTLSGMNIELVSCGEYNTCAVTFSGDLYTWGDGTHNSGLLGHGSAVSHWIPKKVSGHMDGIHVSYISCGPWHTALVTSAGQLFTFGDGSFGALGHGDHSSTNIPREVETLRGVRTTKVCCGVWHTAAVIEVMTESSSTGSSCDSPTGRLFTWGDGDKGRLGHGDKECKLIPVCVDALVNDNVCRVACGHNLTVALTTLGQVYTMGSASYGQLGSAAANGKVPTRVEGKISDSFVEEIACGSNHVAVLTSKTEVYTWGNGSNGQLGHGDIYHRNTPTLVEFLKDKQVKSVACGSNFTAVICLHKWVSSADHSICSSCHNPFGFRRKRHNCYNCGLVFCKACSSRKSLKASLAPNANKPYRVCDDCYTKLKKAMAAGSLARIPKVSSRIVHQKSNEMAQRDTKAAKFQATLLRLSSFGSVIQAESRQPKLAELNNSRIFPTLDGKLQLGGLSSSKASNSPAGAPRKFVSVSVPATRLASRSTSPVTEKSSPHQSSEVTLDGSKHRNDVLSHEIISLKAQVEDLTSKSHHLEAELERTSKKLKEVTAIAADEAQKCKSAKEVIKSLTTQLKEMAERLPEGYIANSADFFSGQTMVPNQTSNQSHVTNIDSPGLESNSNALIRILPNGTKAHTGKSEWVVQDEPGVYVTLSSLPGGANELKRVRFSRRHFTEEQAEKWWAENGDKLCERLNVIPS